MLISLRMMKKGPAVLISLVLFFSLGPRLVDLEVTSKRKGENTMDGRVVKYGIRQVEMNNGNNVCIENNERN
jgi:hypothetical protein